MTEVKKVQDNIIMLLDVRVAFPHFFTASTVNGEGKPAFSGSFIMTPDHPSVQTIRDGITEVAVAKWGDEAAEILRGLIAADRVCLHDGNTKGHLTGYAGNLFVSSRSPTRPLVLDADKSVLAETDGKPYSGCYVNAQVALWAQQNSYGKRVNAQLRGAQFLRDGEAFGGGGVAQADEFDVVGGEDADAPAPDSAATAAAWGDLV